MFDDVAGEYDLTNDVLSLGQDRLLAPGGGARPWTRSPGETVLDLAAGTGTSSEPFADAGVDVVPADFSLGMLRVGNRRRPDLPFTAGDATAAAVRRRHLRRRHHLLRAAQRRRHRRRRCARCSG